MFQLIGKSKSEIGNVLKAAKKATVTTLKITGFAIRREAIQSIKRSPDASEPGQPPRTRRGQLKRAILYNVDAAQEVAIIGPRASLVGQSAAAHEFGGRFRKETFPKRPFMGPALESQASKIPAGFSGQIAN